MRVGDRIFGLVTIVVALGYILSATNIQTSFMSDPVGSKTFPYIIGAVAAFCGLIMLVLPDADPEWPSLAGILNLMIALGALVGYAYALKPLGFIGPTTVVSAILSYQIAPNLPRAILTGAGLAVGLFFLFYYGLGLTNIDPFPKALLG